jgi:outer membrane protein assembly factor BamB
MFRCVFFAGLLVLTGMPFVTGAPLPGADNSTGDWPQWRGPKRDGVSTDTGLLTEWPKGGPKLLWEGKGAGRGYATLAITGGRIYTLGDTLSTADDKDDYASCFDATNGKQLWKTKLGPLFIYRDKTPSRVSPRSTPTVDGDHVYFLTADSDLVCLTTAGKEVWRKNLKKDFGGKKGDGWDYSESPLIDGEKLICTPGGGQNTMAALNKKTGEKIWSAVVAGDKGAGHSSPVIAEVGGTRLYVQTTAGNVLSVRASDGKVQWTYPIGATAVIPTPIVKGDLVFAAAGYGKGGALLRQVAGGDGNVKMEEVYGYKKEMANKHGGVVLIGDYIYGDTDSSGRVWCAKLMTGEVQKGWQKTGSESGSAAITAANGHLYVRYDKGVMALVKASPEAGYKESGSFKIPHHDERPSWSHPVVTGGRLYLREDDYILCYDLKAK